MIKILGREIQVITVPDSDLSVMADLEGCLGLYKGDMIYIASSLQEPLRSRVIIHEAVHAVLSISGLTNLIEDKLEESICDAMETFKGSGVEL